MRIDTSGLQAKLDRIDAGRRRARRSAMNAIGGEIVGRLVAESPRDTLRYVRGWAEAGRQAGVYGGPVPAVRESKWAKKLTIRLRKQVAYWRAVVRNMDVDAGVNGRTSAQARAYSKAVKKLQQAHEQLDNWDRKGIVINAFGSRGKLATVRHKVYGGTGAIQEMPDRVRLLLWNREAHVNIVERKYGVVRKAMGAAVKMGVRRIRKVYADEIIKAARAG